MQEQTGRGAGKGRQQGEGREAGGWGRGGHWAHVPPYQAPQIVLLRLDRERGGPGQRPASKVNAAAQVQMLGPADRSRRGQGARIHYLWHGSRESCSTPIRTPTFSCQTARLKSERWKEADKEQEEGFAAPAGKGSFLR